MAYHSLPLRLESSSDQWWFVTPIDWAAANGHTEVVKELLKMDPSLLQSLTSKTRTKLLDKLWDDQYALSDAAVGRLKVVRELLLDALLKPTIDMGGAVTHPAAVTSTTHIAIVDAGYGAWVLYTAACAGDEALVHKLLHLKPDLIAGDGEFRFLDLLYAAARGKNTRIFQQFLSLAKRLRIGITTMADCLGQNKNNVGNLTMQSKAIIAASKAGNVEMVRELLKDSYGHGTGNSFKDNYGTTALHAAAGRGHLEVVRLVLELCPLSITGQDIHERSALHTAARRGCLEVVLELIKFRKEVLYVRDKNGETPLHAAVMGSKYASFRIMKQGGRKEVIKHLLASASSKDYVNWKNKDGQTALHLAVSSPRIDDKLVKFLLQVPGIVVNCADNEGMMALDIAKRTKSSYPSAEFRCNIAIALITAFGGREFVDPEVRGDSARVDLADPLLCSFSHEIEVEGQGDVSAKGSFESQCSEIKVFSEAHCLPMSKDNQSIDSNNEALSQNLKALRSASGNIFTGQGGGSEAPQCFEMGFLSFANSVRKPQKKSKQHASAKAENKWDRPFQERKWKNFTCIDSESPQSLREQYSSDKSLTYRTTAIQVADSSSVTFSPSITSPSRSMSLTFSPSYVATRLRAFLQSTNSLSGSSHVKKKKKRLRRSEQMFSSGPFPADHEQLDDDGDSVNDRFLRERPSGQEDKSQCLSCVKLFIRRRKPTKRLEAPSFSLSSGGSIGRNKVAAHTNGSVQSSDMACDPPTTDGPNRSIGSSPLSSARPSASLSLSPWLSPSQRAARKEIFMATERNEVNN